MWMHRVGEGTRQAESSAATSSREHGGKSQSAVSSRHLN
jgi:hypothetical protein